MSQIITSDTFDTLHHIIYQYKTGVIPFEVLDSVKGLFYYNKEGDLKNSESGIYPYYDYLFKAYHMEDRSIYKILFDVISNTSNHEPMLKFLMKVDDKTIFDLLNFAYDKCSHDESYYDKKEELIHFLITQGKTNVLQALLNLDQQAKKKKFIPYLNRKFEYKDGFLELSPMKCKNFKFNLLHIALLYDDIISLNLLLNARPKLIKLIKFETLPITLRESLTYLKIVKSQGLEKTQAMFNWDDNPHKFKETNDRIHLTIKNMAPQEIEKLTQGVAKIKEPTLIYNTKTNKHIEKNGIFKNLKNIFGITQKNTIKKVKNKEAISLSILNQDIANHYFSVLEKQYEHFEKEETNALLSFKSLIFNILNLEQMSIRIKSDILLMLEKTLPELMDSYDALLKKDIHNRTIYLIEFLKSFNLLEEKFKQYYEELNELHTQKLALNFAEKVSFIEKKCLNHNH
jgi:hypothetical protein